MIGEEVWYVSNVRASFFYSALSAAPVVTDNMIACPRLADEKNPRGVRDVEAPGGQSDEWQFKRHLLPGEKPTVSRKKWNLRRFSNRKLLRATTRVASLAKPCSR